MFGGRGSGRNVNYDGGKEKSKQELLEQVRLKREQRSLVKLRDLSALKVQRNWRKYVALRGKKQEEVKFLNETIREKQAQPSAVPDVASLLQLVRSFLFVNRGAASDPRVALYRKFVVGQLLHSLRLADADHNYMAAVTAPATSSSFRVQTFALVAMICDAAEPSLHDLVLLKFMLQGMPASLHADIGATKAYSAWVDSLDLTRLFSFLRKQFISCCALDVEAGDAQRLEPTSAKAGSLVLSIALSGIIKHVSPRYRERAYTLFSVTFFSVPFLLRRVRLLGKNVFQTIVNEKLMAACVSKLAVCFRPNSADDDQDLSWLRAVSHGAPSVAPPPSSSTSMDVDLPAGDSKSSPSSSSSSFKAKQTSSSSPSSSSSSSSVLSDESTAYVVGNLLDLFVEHDHKRSTTESAPRRSSNPAVTSFLLPLTTKTIETMRVATLQLQYSDSEAFWAHPFLKQQMRVFGQAAFTQRLCDVIAEKQQRLEWSALGEVFLLLNTMISTRLPQEWTQGTLPTLVYKTGVMRVLWKGLRSAPVWAEEMLWTREGKLDRKETVCELDVKSALADPVVKSVFVGTWSLFVRCYTYSLLVMDDHEFLEAQEAWSLSVGDVITLISMLNQILFCCLWEELLPWADFGEHLTTLFRSLRARQSRLAFSSDEVWRMKSLPFRALFQAMLKHGGDTQHVFARASRVLEHIPFVLAFSDRVELFSALIAQDRDRWARGELGPALHFQHGMGVSVRVSRNSVLDDGYAQLNHLGFQLKGRVRVIFVDQHGIEEKGLDGGGLFKEFLTTVIKTAFDTDYGLYKETAEHKFYPNPSYIDLFPNEEGDLYGFIGRIVGKSLYDGIQIEPQFAKFFLRKVLRLKNYCDDVSSLDQQLFQSLMQLKKFTAEQLAELELTFCVSRAAGDQITVIDLIPDGRDVLVTSDNVRQYIYKVCDYYVNHSIEGHTKAFVNGLSDVLQPGWLQMFAADELQLLISGDEDVDVSDLKKNTNYVGGFSETHEEIKWFWELVEKDFSLEQRKQLIKFATSVPRAPLQGFATLNPKFCVQRTVTSDDMLPTAGTCMNMLRLPRYSSKAVLREKLVYAIESQSGFALS